jgi:hypothetical protein
VGEGALTGAIDVHCHWCVFDFPGGWIEEELSELREAGHAAVVVFVLASLGLPPEKVPLLVPRQFHSVRGLTDIDGSHQDDLDSWFAFARGGADQRSPQVIPFLDVRAWDGELDLLPILARGFRGLKDVLFLEEDAERMNIRPLRHLYGFSREEYRERHRKVFTLAEETGLPLVYHADLTAHADFVADLLSCHPRARVNIAHLGFSRRVMAGFLTEFPALFTDVSALADHMVARPHAYVEFLCRFADQVLLGSDSLMGWDLQPALRHARVVAELAPPDVADSILRRNPRRFLGL